SPLASSLTPLHCPSTFLFSTDTTPTEIYTLSLHDALPILLFRPQVFPERRRVAFLGEFHRRRSQGAGGGNAPPGSQSGGARHGRSEEHTSELQSRGHLVCRLLLEKKKIWWRRGRSEAQREA